MNVTSYQHFLSKIVIGKKLPDALYIHSSAAEVIPTILSDYLESTLKLLELDKVIWNVIKFHRKAFKISLLNYPRFEEDAYPALGVSYTIDLESLTFTKTSYKRSQNPPILHRKELFVLPTHPCFKKFSEITLEGEQAGLYENFRKIGFKNTWDKTLKDKGYKLANNKLVKTD